MYRLSMDKTGYLASFLNLLLRDSTIYSCPASNTHVLMPAIHERADYMCNRGKVELMLARDTM